MNRMNQPPGPGSRSANLAGNQSLTPKAVLASTRRLLSMIKGNGILVLATLVVAVVGTVMQVLTPKMLGNATTVIFAGAQSGAGIDMGQLILVLAAVGVMFLGAFLCTFLQERLMTIVSAKTTEMLRNALKDKLNRLPVSYFDKTSTGELMSVATNDVENISSNLQQSLTMLISCVITVVGTLAMMLMISPLMTLIACLIVPTTAFIAKVITPYAQQYNRRYFASMGEMNGIIEETYDNLILIKSFAGEGDVLDRFQAPNSELCESGWRGRFIGQSTRHVSMLVQNAIYVLIAAVGAVQVIGSSMPIGNLQAFLQYSSQFTSPVSQISMVWSNLLTVAASTDRVYAVLDAEEMAQADRLFPIQREEAKVVFDNVQFGYADTLLMTGFSLEVSSGQTIAIVGHTGAGKTTLVNLLERFYEIQGGSIRLDGVDIRSMTHSQLRSRMAMVLQDTWLFSGTIFENIKFGNVDASDEQVYEAARAAYAEDFILKLPEGYGTILSEDAGNISQGQRQLITIARAFLADAEVLILDEATSSVDTRTEMIVQKAMAKLLAGRTSFVIAHRLSTIYSADRIIVMENGDIVEAGSHLELVGRNGAYADIYNSQFTASAKPHAA